MKLDDFDYYLPKELIAQKPLRPRDSSKLMVLDNGIKHDVFRNIVDYFNEGDVLVLNETKVVKAKLVGKKMTGSAAELILIRKIEDNVYDCVVKTKNPKKGTKFEFGSFNGEIVERKQDTFYVKFDNLDKDKLELPLPPYVKNKVEKEEYYQTSYAKEEGSVAAPTAGFHFTKELIDKLENPTEVIVKIIEEGKYG